jgi:hypothetical protein
MFGKLIGMGTLALAVTVLVSPPAQATSSVNCRELPFLCKGQQPRSAPEIDPGLLRGTLTVLSGGVLMLAERRRRRR